MGTGTRLRQALELAHLGNKAFAREMVARHVKGASYPAVMRYVKGEQEPSVSFLVAAAEVLDVRPEWLLLELGPAQVDLHREQRNVEEYYAGFLPPGDVVASWNERIEMLALNPAARDAMLDLPRAVQRGVSQLAVGNVQTKDGREVWRPGPTLREAMRLEYRAWITFLDAWVDDDGVQSVRDVIEQNLDHVSHRFSTPW